MKKLTIISFLAAVMLFSVAVVNASASPVTFTYTADNEVIGAWYIQNGGSPISFPSGYTTNDWKTANTVTINDFIASPSISYQIIWQAVNSDPRDPSAGNPGGFIAEITTSEPQFKANWLSSSLWQVAFAPGVSSQQLPGSSLTWQPATQWGANNDPGTIWYQNNSGGSIAGISGAAQWIWTAANFGEVGAPGPNDSVFLRTTITDPQSVPEPSILILLGSSFVSLVGFRKKLEK